MIKKAQIKFIAIIMSILMGFFVVLSLITSYFLHTSTKRNIDKKLNEIVITFETSIDNNENLTKIHTNTFIAQIIDKNTINIISLDPALYTESMVVEFTQTAINKPFASGKEEKIFYQIINIKNSHYLFASEMSEQLSDRNNAIVKMALVYLAVYGILFVIVYLFSFSVFEPIKEAFVKQKQFISNASHELKTPLTIISANADVLKQTESNQWVDNIKSQTERLEILVTDMLEMAKIDEQKDELVKEEFNLSEQIMQIALHFDALAFEKGKTLDIDIEPDIIINTHKESVNKIMNILLDNAVKHASNNGFIKVTLYKKNGKILLSVFNTGSSVPDDHASKIFQRFYRSDNSRSRESGGSGLGLAIAKGIADSNKWKISAVSRLDEHMTITIVF